MGGTTKTWIAILVLIIAVIIAVGGVGFYYLSTQNAVLQGQLADVSRQQAETVAQLSAKVGALKDDSSETTVATSTVSAKLKTYVNSKLGFSIDVPLAIANEDKTEPVEVLESGNVVYLTYKSDPDYTRAVKLSKSDSSDVVKTSGIPWAIMIESVGDQQELLTLIKKRYGSSCSIGAKTTTTQDGVYNIEVKGDGLGLDETKCPINFILSVKYAPNLKKVAIWDLGQAPTFISIKGDKVDYFDEQMQKSFKFLK